MSDGLVEVSWYFSSEKFPTTVAFVNLHGDGCETDCKRQIDFLCNICTMHVVLLEDSMLEDAQKEITVRLLQQLSDSKTGLPLIVLTTNKSEQKLEAHVPGQSFIVNEQNTHRLCQRILKRISDSLKKSASDLQLVHFKEIAESCLIKTDEDGENCSLGNKLAKKTCSLITKENSFRKVLKFWRQLTFCNKRKHRQRRKGLQLVTPETQERGWESGRKK